MYRSLQDRLNKSKYYKFLKQQTSVFLSLLNHKKYKYVKKGSYKTINDEELPFKSSCFDLIFSIDVMKHITNDLSFLEQQINTCRSGGEIIIGTPNYYRITNLLLLLTGKLKFPRKMATEYYADCLHIKEYSRVGLLEHAKKFPDLKSNSTREISCWYGLVIFNLDFNTRFTFIKNFCHF